MIIGEDFVIGHPGKTGGDAILHLCGHLSPAHRIHVDRPEDGRKHHYFYRREAEEPNLNLSRKAALLSFRRLPSWLVSYHAHFFRQAGLPVDEKQLMRGRIPFFALNPERTRWSYEPGDALLKEFLDRVIEGWIRMEFLKVDLLSMLHRYLALDPEEAGAIREDPFFKSSPPVPGWNPRFGDTEIKRIRRNNPLWTHYETLLYPDS